MLTDTEEITQKEFAAIFQKALEMQKATLERKYLLTCRARYIIEELLCKGIREDTEAYHRALEAWDIEHNNGLPIYIVSPDVDMRLVTDKRGKRGRKPKGSK